MAETHEQLVARMSRRLNDGQGADHGDWERLRAGLTEEQCARIKAKCRWEHVTWLGVLKDWPELFKDGPREDVERYD